MINSISDSTRFALKSCEIILFVSTISLLLLSVGAFFCVALSQFRVLGYGARRSRDTVPISRFLDFLKKIVKFCHVLSLAWWQNLWGSYIVPANHEI